MRERGKGRAREGGIQGNKGFIALYGVLAVVMLGPWGFLVIVQFTDKRAKISLHAQKKKRKGERGRGGGEREGGRDTV